MAILSQGFSASDLPQGTSSFEPLPSGWYTAIINGAEIKKTKNGDGEYIAVRYDILAPTHQGRVVFGNLNIKNPSTKAEEIGRQQLGEIMRAIGLARVNDTDELIGGQLQIKLDIRKSEQYGDSNEIRGFKASGSTPSLPTAQSQPTQSTGAKAPWAK